MIVPPVTVLTGVSSAQLTIWLNDARIKYAALMSGGQPVSVSYDGKSVTYTAANAAQLLMWISQLQQALGQGCGRRALRPFY